MQRYSPDIKETFERWGDMEMISTPIMITCPKGEYVKASDVIEKLEYFGKDVIYADRYIELLNLIRSLK